MVNEYFLELCKLRAQWWIASATTGQCLSRTLHHGNGTPFTDQEKIDDAMSIAKQHITLYQDHLDQHMESLSKPGSIPPGPE